MNKYQKEIAELNIKIDNLKEILDFLTTHNKDEVVVEDIWNTEAASFNLSLKYLFNGTLSSILLPLDFDRYFGKVEIIASDNSAILFSYRLGNNISYFKADKCNKSYVNVTDVMRKPSKEELSSKRVSKQKK